MKGVIMKTVGFGINMKYNELDGFERVATFENKEIAMALEVEEIFEDNFGGYEYKVLASKQN